MKRNICVFMLLAAILIQSAPASAQADRLSDSDLKRLEKLSRQAEYYEYGFGKLVYLVEHPTNLMRGGLLAFSLLVIWGLMRAVQKKTDGKISGGLRHHHETHKERKELSHRGVTRHGGRERRLHRVTIRELDI